MNKVTFLSSTQTKSSKWPSDWDHLLSGLAIAEWRVRQAAQAAELKGMDPADPIQGLFIGDEQLARLLKKPFGEAVWAHKNGRDHTESLATTPVQMQQAWQTACEANPGSRLNRLIQRFALTPIEVELLLIALLPELDPHYGPLFAFLQDDVTRKRPSINLILDLLTPSLPEKWQLRRLLAPDGRLQTSHLIICQPPDPQPDAPLFDHFVRPAAVITDFLLAHDHLDTEIRNAARLLAGNDSPPGRVSVALIEQIKAAHDAAITPPLFAFIGDDGVGRQEAARHLAATTTGQLLLVELPKLAQNPLGLVEALKLVLRDSRLHAALLYLDGWDTVPQNAAALGEVWQMLLDYPHAVITAGCVSWQPRQHLNGRPLHFVHFPPANHRVRLETWRRLLAENGRHFNLPQLANLFRFNPGQIEDVVATARNLAQWQQVGLTEAHLFTAARQHSNHQLNLLATHITPRYEWDDIVLPPDTKAQLREMIQRVQFKPVVFDDWTFGKKLAYGRGIAALFTGESGTGKTMAASIIAGDLGLELYKIDLSSLVSKYIGETEKNLERVFTEAITSNAILFFDEADAVFGKRSEIQDSHDRYANLEVSYLLQRMERFDGIVILASNLQTNIDEAFIRRLDFIIEFPFPQKTEREHIWQVSVPAAMPLADDIDFALLAERFELSGGNIRNGVLGAAFLAAAEEQAVGMAHLLHAARREYQKLGRLIDETLFAVVEASS
jgi:ATP-dependent 26S proteasome regulatory subunit